MLAIARAMAVLCASIGGVLARFSGTVKKTLSPRVASFQWSNGRVMQLHPRVARMKFMATKPPSSTPASVVHRPVPDDGGSVVLERLPQKTQPPQMYRVLMLNDDYTPMEFVIVVLQEFFSKDREQATQIMLKIHLDGKGVCGVYSRDVAATKVDQVLEAALKAGHPLQCVSEPVE